jgi:hypothetical protein
MYLAVVYAEFSGITCVISGKNNLDKTKNMG